MSPAVAVGELLVGSSAWGPTSPPGRAVGVYSRTGGKEAACCA